ncbi:MAG: sulfite exporter TauE/SafE family protein [Longimicrobiales bacterium]
MPDVLVQPLLLFATGLVAGALNVIAGGGSLLSLPVMIFLGLPPTVANGTNRVAILAANVGATASFYRRRKIPAGWVALALPPALVGAGLGTWVAVQMGEAAFQRVLAVVLVLVAAASLWRPGAVTDEMTGQVPEGPRRWAYRAAFLLVGVYGGFIQAGVGFLVLAVAAVGGLDLVRGNAMKVAIVLGFTPLSLGIFALTGKVDWGVGAALAVGTLLGGLAGVHVQILKGQEWIRKVVTVMIVLFAIRLLTGA